MNRTYLKLPACIFVLGALLSLSLAQQKTGGIKGAVTDQLSSLVVNATVFAKDAAGVERKVSTDSSGSYEFKGLPSGSYDLKVVAVGFEIYEEKNVVVAAGAITKVDLQLNVGAVEQSVTVEEKGVSTDSDRNSDALVLRGRDLDTLPDQPEALAAALQSLAGPPQGENGPGGAQVKVDGFSNGQIPPKEAIREVRVNQNPFSAENEYPGWNGIEIFTQPGSDKFHGGASFNFNDESLNSRNPFALRRAPYQQRSFNANLTGPIVPKRASFTLYLGHNATESNAVVNATTLDLATLRPTLFNQTIVTPQHGTYLSTRGDLKLNKKHTLVGNFEYNKSSNLLQGIGGFSLPSRSSSSRRTYQALQLTETAIVSEKIINEARLQLSHSTNRQVADSMLPALNVLDSFFGGGAQIGSSSNQQDRGELQDFVSWSTGNHFIKIGGRVRYVRVESISPSNFGGTYTFAGGTGPSLDANDQLVPGGATIDISSLERYRRTLLFQRLGFTAAQIRSLGGGATQFSLAGGNPLAKVSQRDGSVYFQDEWKLRPNLTVSPGLRYENQTNISSEMNFAPRFGFAWSPLFGSKKKQPVTGDGKNTAALSPAPGATSTAVPASSAKAAGPGPSKTVIRGGIGIFYNRIQEDLTLNALRFNGLNQRQFVVTDPTVLDLFPSIPGINLLDAFAQPQTRRFIDPRLEPSYSLRSTIGVERQLPHNLKLTLNYSHSQSFRTLRTVNINAPLGGTYNPLVSSSGVRPLGTSAGNILEYQASGRFKSDSISVSLNHNGKKLSFWSSYTFAKNKSLDNGTSGSSFDAYDFSNEWGRSQFDIHHFFYANSSYQGPFGLNLNGFLIATSGNAFNITTGHDTNGDTFFSERPALATDLNKPGVVITPFGALDPNPAPGQSIIPRNFGKGPGFLSVNLGLSKTIKFGRAIPTKTVPAPSPGNVVAAGSNQKPATKQPIQRPYQISFAIYASNALNHANQGNPVGNMASPYFLKSTTSSNIFFGSGGSGGNRQLSLRLRFSF